MAHAPGEWVLPPAELRIGDFEVHLWRVSLSMEPPQGVESMLSPDELARAERFRFERDKRRYALSNYAVREILSRYLGILPGDIPIAVSVRGKPYLKEADMGQGIHFSLSHARGTAMVAIAKERVGVDVEEMNEDYPHMEVAEGFFARGEADALREMADPLRRAALFFSYWTRKEALLKASGEGLYEDLGAIDFSRHGSAPESRVEYKSTRWTVLELAPDEGLFCSLVLEGRLQVLERYAWEPRRIV